MKQIPGQPKATGASLPQTQEGPRLDERIMDAGRYEATENDTFDITVAVKQHEGRWVVTQDKDVDAEVHTVTFRMWTFEEEVKMKRNCMAYDKEKRMNFVDNDVLDRMKVQRLMKSWTFDRDNPRLKLLHVQGVLADESWTVFKRLHRNISRYIIDEMNKVLEYYG